MKIIGVIPARYKSSRFPGKPLVDICGKPMIWWVYQQAKKVPEFDEVYVATDDDRIEAACKEHDMKVIMTSDKHETGSDRVAEVATKVEGDLFVNIQGDEPFVSEEQLSLISGCFDEPSTQIATLVKAFAPHEDIFNSNSPKVVLSADGHALYFSRSAIPFLRGVEPSQWQSSHTYYKHIGLYAYRSDVLRKITALPQGILERCESLEQLRWLENGYRIRTAVTMTESLAIDTPQDLQAAVDYMLGRTK